MRTPEGWAAPWTDEEVGYLRQNYAVTPVKDIAAHLSRSYNAVVLRAKIEGLKSKHRAGNKSGIRWTIASGNLDFLSAMKGCIQGSTGIKINGPYKDKGKSAWSIAALGGAAQAIDEWVHQNVPGLPRKRLSCMG